MQQQQKEADFLVLKNEKKQTLYEMDVGVIFLINSLTDMGDTYFGHTLWWCSVQIAPQTMSRKAHTVCHDEECRIHCRWEKEYFI